jgi:hypothetical protein
MCKNIRNVYIKGRERIYKNNRGISFNRSISEIYRDNEENETSEWILLNKILMSNANFIPNKCRFIAHLQCANLARRWSIN